MTRPLPVSSPKSDHSAVPAPAEPLHFHYDSLLNDPQDIFDRNTD